MQLLTAIYSVMFASRFRDKDGSRPPGEKFLQQQKDPLKEAQEAEDATEEVAFLDQLRRNSWQIHVEAAAL